MFDFFKRRKIRRGDLPVLLITGRREDAWLAAWSRAEASVIHPIDPFTLANTVANLMRTRAIATA
jgi:hypothetical protein